MSTQLLHHAFSGSFPSQHSRTRRLCTAPSVRPAIPLPSQQRLEPFIYRNERCLVTAAATSSRSAKGESSSGSDSQSRPRLAKVLASCGVASRRACEALIEAGRVKVNGTVVTEQGTSIDPAKDRVHVRRELKPSDAAAEASAAADAPSPSASPSGSAAAAAGAPAGAAGKQPRRPPAAGGAQDWYPVPVTSYGDSQSLYYFAVNKPKGYICSNADAAGRGKLAVELLEPWLAKWRRENKDPKRLPPRFFTVGRLDVASHGLIFITNDGQWANSVIHPSSGVTKEYQVTLSHDASLKQLQAMAAGTQVAGTLVVPVEVEVLGDPRRLRVVVEEGKKHEVRELAKAAGMELVGLKRVRIGGFRMPQDLGVGGYRPLKASELRAVTDASAQASASLSGPSRSERLQADRRRAAKAVPEALKALPADVLERLRKAQE